MKQKNTCQKQVLGGQAIIEGVMMKSPHYIAISVRKNTGGIKTTVERFDGYGSTHPWARLPFIRGIINLGEMVYVGTKALHYSSNESLGEDEKLSSAALIGTILFSFFFAIVLFKGIPFFGAYLF